MRMELNMTNDMHLGINWRYPVTPTGFIGILVSFVGRSSIAFHNLPIVHRPYGTWPHRKL